MRGFLLSIFLLGAGAGCIQEAREARGPVVIRLEPDPPAPGRGTFRVLGLPESVLEALSGLAPEPARCASVFPVYAEPLSAGPAASLPPMLGAYRVRERALEFEPRFPLEPGLRYRAVFQREGGAPPDAVTAVFSLPKPALPRTTLIEAVYPLSEHLPENLLKFYIHFSAAMSRGRSYDHIHLLDARGAEVEVPFLSLDEELWDPEARRFTLFLDPGRIKRGIHPLEEVGPSLENGKTYTLVVDQDWLDARGAPLREGFRKAFRVGPPDRRPPSLEEWKVVPPPAGTREPLVLEFPEPLDHALLGRLISVQDGGQRSLAGVIEVGGEERRWTFTPAAPWESGLHALLVDTVLEDLAGNSIGRPFEVDVFESIERRVERKVVEVPFEVLSR